VAVSSNIMRILQERDWIKTVGHRDVPGRPAVYATTKEFLDYFGLKSLAELPSLAELKDFDAINADLFANIVMDEEQAASEGGENVVQAATVAVSADEKAPTEDVASEAAAPAATEAPADAMQADTAEDAPPAADEHEAASGG
jgi:segregation and condensation protein B